MLELLLANHPLDCPVCDKGGECPLQDQAFSHGPGESRYVEAKRNYEKPIPVSDLVLLDRERCILCDRCTRFADEVAGDKLIHFISRGNHTAGQRPSPTSRSPSYFSGNTVQICPVGALTATPYRFKARPWDLAAGRVDLHDVLGRLPDLGPVEPRRAVALPGRRHRRRLGQLGLAVRPRPVQLRGHRVRRDSSRRVRSIRPATDVVDTSSRSRGAARWPLAKQLVEEAGDDRRARRRTQHQRGRLRLGAARRRPGRRVPRRPARRRSARRGARPAAGHHRRRRQRRHGDPARARPQGRAAGAVPPPPRRRRSKRHHAVIEFSSLDDRPDAVRLAQRALPARRASAAEFAPPLADADVADAARRPATS